MIRGSRQLSGSTEYKSMESGANKLSKNLITPQELKEKLDAGNPPKVLDVRWSLAQPDGRADYAEGHIPGAVYVSLDEELSDLSKQELGGHPLPSPETVDELIQRLGVIPENEVVVYDDWNRSASARAWWVLSASGMTNVRILDGGYSGWVDAGGEVETTENGDDTLVHPVDVPDLYQSPVLPVIDREEAAAVAGSGVLLDARAPERYAGQDNPEGEVPGHIPGARSLAGTSLLDEKGFFRSAEELSQIFADAGIDKDTDAGVGAYCGSGVTACVVIAAADSIGLEVALFPGSWSQWSAEEDAPVELGEDE